MGEIALASPFLTAHWHHMAVLNFRVDPELLQPRVPAGTELDLFEGRALVSVVGFMFSNTRILGVPVPLHREFEEVNLRYYVRRQTKDSVRRGVTFIKEIVPLRAVALTARVVYNENFIRLPMRHTIDLDGVNLCEGGVVEYGWRLGSRWYRLRVKSEGSAFHPPLDSEARFVTDHLYGYTNFDPIGCMEYSVAHPDWRIWRVSDVELITDVTALYGAEFERALQGPPCSAFVCEGSPVSVFSRKYVTARQEHAMAGVG
jgi:hypothetical protein